MAWSVCFQCQCVQCAGFIFFFSFCVYCTPIWVMVSTEIKIMKKVSCSQYFDLCLWLYFCCCRDFFLKECLKKHLVIYFRQYLKLYTSPTIVFSFQMWFLQISFQIPLHKRHVRSFRTLNANLSLMCSNAATSWSQCPIPLNHLVTCKIIQMIIFSWKKSFTEH